MALSSVSVCCGSPREQKTRLEMSLKKNLIERAAVEHSEGGDNCQADAATCLCRGPRDAIAS